MKIRLTAILDYTALVEALLENADLTGLGPSETSEYEILSTDVVRDDATLTITVEVERTEGANASRADVADRLIDALSESDYLIDATEVVQQELLGG